MKLFNSKKTVVSDQKADGCHLPFGSFWQHKVQLIFIIIFVLSAVILMINWGLGLRDDMALKKQQVTLQEEMQMEKEETIETNSVSEPVMLSEYKVWYDQNNDFAGWLRIEDTVIDYPVMQCLGDEFITLSCCAYHVEDGRFVVVGKRIYE